MSDQETIVYTTDDNLNQLRNSNFELVLRDMPFLRFFCTDVQLPVLSVGNLPQKRNAGRGFQLAGNHLEYTDLIVDFILDEDFSNYNSILLWLKATVNADADAMNSFEQLVRKNLPFENALDNRNFIKYAIGQDASIIFPNNNYISNIEMKFQNLFPTSLASPKFSTTEADTPIYTVTANFTFDTYTLSRV